MSNIEKPPLDAAMVNQEGRLKSPWFEYFESQTRDINGLNTFDITGQTDATITASDEISFADVSDSNNIKKDTVQGILDLIQAGTVLDTQSTRLSSTFSTSSSTWTDVTGLSVSVTPTSSSDKVLVRVHTNADINWGSYYRAVFRVLRDSTPIGVGDSSGNRIQATAGIVSNSGSGSYAAGTLSFEVYDSPSTTNSVTYKVQVASIASASTVYINRLYSDANSTSYYVTSSSITAEVRSTT